MGNFLKEACNWVSELVDIWRTT